MNEQAKAKLLQTNSSIDIVQGLKTVYKVFASYLDFALDAERFIVSLSDRIDLKPSEIIRLLP